MIEALNVVMRRAYKSYPDVLYQSWLADTTERTYQEWLNDGGVLDILGREDWEDMFFASARQVTIPVDRLL